MVLPYEPPSKWYYRRYVITFNIWPEWLAQLLCPHERTTYIGTLTEASGKVIGKPMYSCEDCYKVIQKEEQDGSIH